MVPSTGLSSMMAAFSSSVYSCVRSSCYKAFLRQRQPTSFAMGNSAGSLFNKFELVLRSFVAKTGLFLPSIKTRNSSRNGRRPVRTMSCSTGCIWWSEVHFVS